MNYWAKNKLFHWFALLLLPLSHAWGQQTGFMTEKNNGSGKLKKIGNLDARRSDQIEASPWSVEFNVLPPHVNFPAASIKMDSIGPLTDMMLEQAANLGIKWTRVSVSWTSIEAAQGKYNWEHLDKIIDGLRKRSITPYVCINGNHPLHTEKLPPTTNDAAFKAWLAMVEAMVKRYKDKVKYWEIWNEPNFDVFWQPTPEPAAYVKMVKAASPLIKSIDPQAIVIGGSLARLDAPYAKSLFEQGIAPFIDVFTFHPYNDFPEATVKKISYPVKNPELYIASSHQIDELKAYIAASENKNIALWQGECGFPSGEHSKGWMGIGPWGENIQAKWLLRRMLTDIQSGCKLSSYFLLQEYTMGSGLNNKGLLHLQNKAPKPAYHAYQHLTALIDKRYEVSNTITATSAITSTGTFYGAENKTLKTVSLTDNAKQSNMVAYWLPWHPQELINAATTNITVNIAFKNPVLVDLMDGSVYQLTDKVTEGHSTFTNLPLTDYPMLIISKDDLKLAK